MLHPLFIPINNNPSREQQASSFVHLPSHPENSDTSMVHSSEIANLHPPNRINTSDGGLFSPAIQSPITTEEFG